MEPTINTAMLDREALLSGAFGSAGQRLAYYNMDPGALRPWKELDSYGRPTGRSCITVNTGRCDEKGKPLKRNVYVNAPTFLTRAGWLQIDAEVREQAKKRLQFWNDVRTANPVNVKNGLGTLVIQHNMAATDASVGISMDPVRRAERTRTTQKIGLIPLPCLYADGNWGIRDKAVAQASGQDLDTAGIKAAGRKIGEYLEQFSLGQLGTYTFNTAVAYGLTNFPNRITSSTLTLPTSTSPAWTPGLLIGQILAAIKALEDNFYYGPYVLYHSNGWGPYFDADYIQYYGKTLRNRLSEIGKITRVQNLDFLSDFQLILVQLTSDVVEGVQGLPLSTVQWDEAGGMESFWRVWCINIPRFRADWNGNTGINHMVGA